MPNRGSPPATPPSLPAPSSNNKSLFQLKTLLLFISLCLLFFNLYFYQHVSFIYFALTQGGKGDKSCLDSSWFPPNLSIYSFLHQDQSSAVSLPRDVQNAAPAPLPGRLLRGFTQPHWCLLFPSGLLFSLQPQVLCGQVS